MTGYDGGMVSMTIELSEERAATLHARALAEGVTVSELVAQALDLADGDYDFKPEEARVIMESLGQADRGEVVPEEVALAALRAARRLNSCELAGSRSRGSGRASIDGRAGEG